VNAVKFTVTIIALVIKKIKTNKNKIIMWATESLWFEIAIVSIIFANIACVEIEE